MLNLAVPVYYDKSKFATSDEIYVFMLWFFTWKLFHGSACISVDKELKEEQ